jgi:hypothetical protein
MTDLIDFALKYGVRTIDTESIIRDAWQQGRPVEGEFAAYVWRVSNRIEVSGAKRMMERAGYIPFEGYPLKRSRREAA